MRMGQHILPLFCSNQMNASRTLCRCRYCSSFYRESSQAIEECDLCQSAESSSKHRNSSKKTSLVITNKSEYSGEKMKQQHEDNSDHNDKGKSPTPSPRTATHRSTLFKEVWLVH